MRTWAIVVAVVLALAMAGAWPWLSAWTLKPPSWSLYLPAMPVALLLLLAALRCFRPSELVLVLALQLGVCGVAGSGLVTPWYDALFARTALARDPARAPLAEAFPAALAVAPPPPLAPGAEPGPAHRLVEGIERGSREGLPPLAPLAGPLLVTGIVVLAWLAMILGLLAATHRQWSAHERLQHPLAEVTGSLCGDGWRARPFLLGGAVALLPWLWSVGFQFGLHPLPDLVLKVRVPELPGILGMDHPAADVWVLKDMWAAVEWKAYAVGLAFLLVPAVSLSTWSGFWIAGLVFGWLYAAGVPVVFQTEGRAVGGGAMLAFAAMVLWAGRHHYLALVAAAAGRGAADGDRTGIWGVRAVVAGAVVAAAVLSWAGGHWAAGPIAVLLVLLAALVLARVVAESGLVAFQTAQDLVPFAYSLGLPGLLPAGAVFAALWLAATGMADTRTNLAGHGAHATGAAVASTAGAGIGAGRILLWLAALLPAIILLALAGRLLASWVMPSQAPGDAVWRPAELSAALAGAGVLSPWPVAAGAILVLAVAWARRAWTGLPLHPIGIVVAFSFPVWQIWGSLMLGWLAKVAVLRLAGLGLYQRLRPVAMGLMAGDAVGMTVQSLARIGQ
ncbi:MAG: hypothetical protein RLZZ127_1465 [Planctomycetota bacterium]|jgi:hypothetical protein